MKVDILVLNYNGKTLMEKFLSSVVKASERSRHQCQITVVDNLSVDGSTEFLRKEFPLVNIFVAKKNEVLCSYNEALKTLDSDIVILLNNDIKVREDFVDYLTEHFKEEDVFFVAPRLLNFDGSYNGGRSYLKFRLGILKGEVDIDNAELPGETHSISTGAFRRKDFLKFGGFDRLYLPGIWEEVDICYKALLSGKKGIYEPNSIIWHNESTTFNREYGKRGKLIIAHRNMFLFFWKSIYDNVLIAKHLFFLPFRIMHSIFSGKTELAQGFILAVFKLPLVLSRRYRDIKQVQLRKLKDRDIIK